MSVKSANYDRIAPYYSAITRVISMGGNRRAQRWFLPRLQPTDRVLHVGCGSVGFNVDLARTVDDLTCLDISQRMLHIVERKLDRELPGHTVRFVHADVTTFHDAERFDAVFANFFLNTFQAKDLAPVLGAVASLVRPDGLLCIADEVVPTRRSAILANQAFRPLVTWVHHAWVEHPLHDVHDYGPYLDVLGFQAVARARDSSDYIESTIYRRLRHG